MAGVEKAESAHACTLCACITRITGLFISSGSSLSDHDIPGTIHFCEVTTVDGIDHVCSALLSGADSVYRSSWLTRICESTQTQMAFERGPYARGSVSPLSVPVGHWSHTCRVSL